MNHLITYKLKGIVQLQDILNQMGLIMYQRLKTFKLSKYALPITFKRHI